ncbi:MAG TPA: GNAT family N-acetyltransferase, partial [Hellea balneolensis]|nr:GNAT family N-acetyltransferase [Hellea balneolensis]
KRIADIERAARNLPKGAALIYRHFGAQDSVQTAQKLRDICTQRHIQFLIGADAELAEHIGADGVHLPERDMEQAKFMRAAHPHWIITSAVHSQEVLQRAETLPLDAVILSPVFDSKSPSAGKALGAKVFATWISKINMPVFALGGIDDMSAPELIGSGAAGLAGVSAFARCVRRLDMDDVAGMTVLHQAAFSSAWPASDFESHINKKCDDVLGIGGQDIDGFVIVRTIEGQAEILTLVVATSAQGQGLGAHLLAHAHRAAQVRGANIVFLDVAQDNLAATALYEKAGYQRCGVRPRYYKRVNQQGIQGRVDALLFQKNLT